MICIVLCSETSKSMTIEEFLSKRGITVYAFKDMSEFNNGFVPPFGDKPIKIDIKFCIVASKNMPVNYGYEQFGFSDLPEIQEILKKKNISFILCLEDNLSGLEQLKVNEVNNS